MNQPMTQQARPTMQASPGVVHLRPQNVEQTPNVLAEQAKLFTPPDLGYWWSYLSDQFEEVVDQNLKQVTQESGDAFLSAFESAVRGLHLSRPEPRERLLLYRRKPVELWIEQRAKFPWAFQSDWQDWERLEGRLIPQPPPFMPGPDLSGIVPPPSAPVAPQGVPA